MKSFLFYSILPAAVKFSQPQSGRLNFLLRKAVEHQAPGGLPAGSWISSTPMSVSMILTTRAMFPTENKMFQPGYCYKVYRLKCYHFAQNVIRQTPLS